MTGVPAIRTALSVEEARGIVLDHVPLMPPERVGIIESLGRVLAQDVASDMDISPFDNSAMDGFAVRFEDFKATRPTKDAPLTLAIAGIIGAGEVFDRPLHTGEALRIMTGAPLPKGADTIIKIEDALVCDKSAEHPEGSTVAISKMPTLGEHVRKRGDEARRGEVLFHVGDKVGAASVGLLASTGNAEVLVYGRPRVAIISTGSELVSVTDIPGPGQIRNSNSYSIAAAVIEAGGIPTIMPSAKDACDVLADALKAAIAEHDFVITSGGASVGDFDFIAPVVRELGELFFNTVSMKPGKAQIFGVIDGKPVFGLPGNPGAATVGFEILIRPALRRMQGIAALNRPIVQASLTKDIEKSAGPRRSYLRARLEIDSDKSYRVTPDASQSSALLGALSRSNCLMVLPASHGPLSAGDIVDCLRLDVEEGVV